MRAAIASLFLLAACSRPAPPPPAAAPSPYPDAASIANVLTDIAAVGEGWQLDVNPFYGASLVEHGQRTFVSSHTPNIDNDHAGTYAYIFDALTVTLHRADCSEGGVSYPLTSTVTRTGGATLHGCAYEQWDGRFESAAAVADLCAPVGPNARRITAFEITQGNVMLVRVRGESGGVDCRVSNERLSATPRDTSLRVGGEGELDLIRTPAPTPTDPCLSSAAIMGGFRPIGWMVQRDVCHGIQPYTP